MYIVYTENLDNIYIVYAMYMLCILYVYTNDIPKPNMEMLPAGQGRRTSFATQTVSSKRLDEMTDFNVLTLCPKDEL